MPIKVIMLIILVVSMLEIFLNISTSLLEKVIGLFVKNFEFKQKTTEIIKFIFVTIFMVSVIFFLIQVVKVLAMLLGISLDKSILDIFR